MADIVYNFNDNARPEVFTNRAGNLFFEDGRVRGTSGQDNIVTTTAANSNNMAGLTVRGNSAQGVVSRYVSTSSYFRLICIAGELTLRKASTVLTSYTIPNFDSETDYVIALKSVGGVFTCYVYGSEVPELGYTTTESDANSTSAEVGLFFYGTGGDADNFTIFGDQPTITLNGDNPQYVVNGDAYVELGATATDVLDGDIDPINITITGAVDTSVNDTYTDAIAYSVTDSDGNTSTVYRTVIVRPANYIPDASIIEPNITAISGSAVTMVVDAADLDGDTLTYAWLQVDNGAATVTLLNDDTSECSLVTPEVTANELLEFTVSVSDGVNAPVVLDATVNVTAAVPAQRVSASKTNVAKFESSISLTIPDETGFVSHDVALINKKSGEGILNEVVEFNDGAATVPISIVRGVPYTGTISEGVVFPADNAQPVMGASTGEVICYANEMLNSRTGLFPDNTTSIGDLGTIDGSFYTDRGALVTKVGENAMYSPNGKFDYLNPGEVAYDYIKYFVGDSERFITIKILPSQQVGNNIAGTDSLVTNYAFVDGKTYEIAFTVSGMTQGEITPLFDQTSVNDNDYSLSKNAREVWHMKAPTNTTKLTLTGTNGFDGVVSDLHVREVFKPQQAVSPRKLEIRSIRKAQPFLQPIMHPLFNIMDTVETVDIEYTGELNFNSEFGIRHTSPVGNMTVIDATSTGKRGAVSLRGGDNLYIDNVDVYCGYPTESSRFQTGYSPSETNGGQFNHMVFLNDHINMDIPSHEGDYSNGSNSDNTVFNSDNSTDQGYSHTAYSGNRYLYDPGDGVIDAKLFTIVNYFTGENGWRVMRGHAKSIHLTANASLAAGDTTQSAFHVAYTRSRNIIFNTYVNGLRLVDDEDLSVDKVLAGDVPFADALATTFIAKTMPNVTDNILFAFDELHGQYKDSASDTWVDLPTLYHNHAGALGWHLNVTDGTYDFRVKSILGTNDGGWTYSNGVEVLNVTA